MKYIYKFQSRNDEQWFTLTFEVAGSKRIHVLSTPQVYQHTGDLFCTVASRMCSPGHYAMSAESLVSPSKFSIEVFILPEGVELFIVEKVITTIAHELIKPTIA